MESLLWSRFLAVTSIESQQPHRTEQASKGSGRFSSCAALQGEQAQVIILSRQNKCLLGFFLHLLSITHTFLPELFRNLLTGHILWEIYEGFCYRQDILQPMPVLVVFYVEK